MPTLAEIQQEYKNIVPRPVVKIAQGLGIEVFETDGLSDHQSGLIRKEGDKYVILVNEKQPFTRKRFTIAHEIGHFLEHKEILDHQEFIDVIKQPVDGREECAVTTGLNLSDVPSSTPEERVREVQANKVAVELLMPEEEFRAAWKIASTMKEVADKFQVSEGAVAVRAGQLLNETIV